MTASTKRCTCCGWELRLSQFARDASKASGFKSICKPCDREKARRYYEQNREKKLTYMVARNAALREARGGRPRRSGGGRRRFNRPEGPLGE